MYSCSNYANLPNVGLIKVAIAHNYFNSKTLKHTQALTCCHGGGGGGAVVAVLPVGRVVVRVAVLAAVLLAVGGPVLLWLPTVCHGCLLGRRGRGRVTCHEGGRTRGEVEKKTVRSQRAGRGGSGGKTS